MIKVFLYAAIIAPLGALLAEDQIHTAIDEVMSQSCLSNYRVSHSVSEWGVPPRLLTEPSFTNLVRVVGVNVNTCEYSFVEGLTNDIHREVFKVALAGCGQTVYRNTVVRWFGGSVVPDVSPMLMEEFVSPAATSMEGYFIDQYDRSEISNVWLNIRSRYLAIGDAGGVARVDRVLSGEIKAMRETLERLEPAAMNSGGSEDE